MNPPFPPNFQPLLAAPSIDEDLSKIKYPVLGTPKIDGIRALVTPEGVFSRKLKLIPNDFIQRFIRALPWVGFDGELMVGNNFQQVTSGIMSEDGEPDFTFYVFDLWNAPGRWYEDRMDLLRNHVALLGPLEASRLHVLFPQLVRNHDELIAYNKTCLDRGLEGCMIRSPEGLYKYGRSTFREGTLVKIKPFKDDEATINGFIEQEQNNNEATTDELGHTKRSSHQANKTGKNTLGAISVIHPKFGQFNIGTGFDDALRKEIWTNWQKYYGKIVKFRYQEMGTKNKPRIPVFLGFRDERDL